jgi:putative SOS response-associated peptidase YedK
MRSIDIHTLREYRIIMCVRIYLIESDELETTFNISKLDDIVRFRLQHLDQVGNNLSPENSQLIIYQDLDNQKYKMEVAKWGLVPSFSKTIETEYNMVNTRIESIIEKPFFKRLSHHHRCLIPVNGYYEWSGVKGSKQPHAIYNKKSKYIYLAGLWDIWGSQGGDEVLSFSVITKPADSELLSIHPRMPLLMNEKEAKKWIDNSTDKQYIDQFISAAAMMKNYAIETQSIKLSTAEVDKSLNNPTNTDFRVKEFLD